MPKFSLPGSFSIRWRPTWHIDETFVRIAGPVAILFRAVDGQGQTVDFYLSERRDQEAAKSFLKKALVNPDNRPPRGDHPEESSGQAWLFGALLGVR